MNRTTVLLALAMLVGCASKPTKVYDPSFTDTKDELAAIKFDDLRPWIKGTSGRRMRCPDVFGVELLLWIREDEPCTPERAHELKLKERDSRMTLHKDMTKLGQMAISEGNDPFMVVFFQNGKETDAMKIVAMKVGQQLAVGYLYKGTRDKIRSAYKKLLEEYRKKI